MLVNYCCQKLDKHFEYAICCRGHVLQQDYTHINRALCRFSFAATLAVTSLQQNYWLLRCRLQPCYLSPPFNIRSTFITADIRLIERTHCPLNFNQHEDDPLQHKEISYIIVHFKNTHIDASFHVFLQ